MANGVGLEGRTALVTGGSSGIGLAVAQGLHNQGAAVAIVARSQESLEKAQKQLEAEGPDAPVLALIADVQDYAAVVNAVAETRSWSGRLDIVINCAGPQLAPVPLADMDASVLTSVLDTKLVGFLRVAQAALPHLESGTGRIVNIAGATAHTTVPNAGVTGIVNSAVNALTSYLAQEAAVRGITVNAISPGMTLTAGWLEKHEAAAKIKGLSPDDVRSGMVDALSISLGRWASPDEIANVAVFLASDLSSYITGQVIKVDGGLGTSVI
jgi:3-oxoacyl-[acyl-carrier protein] reductase